MSIEDRNYYNDRRTHFRDHRSTDWRLDEKRMVAIVPRLCAEHGDEGNDPTDPCEHCAKIGTETDEQREERHEAESESRALIASPSEIEIPFVWAVCDLCRGKGSHVNPSIDCNGLTGEDFDEDPDFAESYMRGDYDVQCGQCNGRRVVPELNPTTADQKAALDVLDEQEADDAAYERECRAERAAGC
jgi:hypothetical protein